MFAWIKLKINIYWTVIIVIIIYIYKVVISVCLIIGKTARPIGPKFCSQIHLGLQGSFFLFLFLLKRALDSMDLKKKKI